MGIFEEYAAQGKDMIRRLQAEIGLSTIELNDFPPYSRVPYREVSE